MLGAALLLPLAGSSVATFADVDALLAEAALKEVPGAVAMAGDASGQRYLSAHGNFTNDGRPPYGVVTVDTIFDLASLSKVVATTSAVALMQQRGLITLQDRIASAELLGPSGFGSHGKDQLTVEHCMTHSAGFPEGPSPCYWSPTFGCQGAPLPDADPDFRCAARAFADFNQQVLVRAPGSLYQYSDLSMITMMYVVGKVVRSHSLVANSSLLEECRSSTDEGVSLQCHFEAFVRNDVLGALNMTKASYRPVESVRGSCMPTAVPHAEGTGFRTLQGEVNDGNAFFLGGISGHAGLFARAADLEQLVRALLFPDGRFLSRDTVELFTSVRNASFSTRALGWDTNSSLCAGFSELTFTHTGYTGTQICADPTTKRYSILLTNRVYPVDDDASESRISSLRKRFNTATAAALDGTVHSVLV